MPKVATKTGMRISQVKSGAHLINVDDHDDDILPIHMASYHLMISYDRYQPRIQRYSGSDKENGGSNVHFGLAILYFQGLEVIKNEVPDDTRAPKTHVQRDRY